MDGLFDIDLDNEPVTRLLRGLKGGSGGGGGGGGGGRGGGYSSGGSYGSSGGYYGSSSSYSSQSSSSSGVSFWPIVLTILAVVAIVICCICNKKRRSGGIGSDAGFDAAVAEARGKDRTTNEEAITEYLCTNMTPPFKDYSGDFDVKYIDRGTEFSGTSKIRLTNAGGRYKIEGECSDADGSATITEGFASYTGSAYWVEEIMAGTDKGLKVLTEGTFDFSNNTLSNGTWRANTGNRGAYTRFKGSNVSKNFYRPGEAFHSNPQTLQEMLEVDIPMAVATLETPSVDVEAPVVVQAVPEPAVAIPTASSIPAPSAPPAPSSTVVPEPYVPRV